jgi:hypothetical protein
VKRISIKREEAIEEIVLMRQTGGGYNQSWKETKAKWDLGKSTFDRYWKEAGIRHADRQAKIREATASIDIAAAMEEREGAVAGVMERKIILTNIARGVSKQRVIAGLYDGKVIEHDCPPSFRDITAAVKELNAMGGDYAPAKIANTTVNGEDVPVPITLTLPPGLNINLPSNIIETEDDIKVD